MQLSCFAKLLLIPTSYLFFSSVAHAAITVTFSYDGTNTIGVVSGSIALPSVPAGNDFPNPGPEYIDAGGGGLLVHKVGTPSYDAYNGTAQSFVQLFRPSSWSGSQSFGFNPNAFYTGPSEDGNANYSPIGTFTWNNTTLEQLGVNDLATPLLVFTVSNGQEIYFQTAPVPESSSIGLLALSAVAAACSRRRTMSTRN